MFYFPRYLTLLFNESTNVIFKLGYKIFNTIPGKPAPLPISHKVLYSFKFIIFAMVALS